MLGLSAASAATTPLELTTGTLHFSPALGGPGKATFKSGAPTVPVAGLDAPAPGSWAFTVSPSILATAADDLNAAMKGCGHVQSYLHPNAYHVHVRENEGLCLTSAAKVPGVEGVSFIPAELLTDPLVMGGTTRDFPPLRGLSLTMVRNATYEGIAADLTPTMLAHCPQCAIFPPGLGAEFFISSLEGEVCSTSCQIDSPLDCGCTIPEPLVRFAAAHRDVAWTERVVPVYSNNAFGRGMMETTDIANSGPVLIREYGTCTDSTCNHAGDLPFSQIPTLFPGPFAAPPPTANIPSTLTQTPASAMFAPVPRRTGLNFTGLNYTAVLASIPEYATAAGLTSDIGQCLASCAGLSCGFGFGLCSDLVSPTFLAGLTGRTQIIQVADTGLDVGLPFFFDGTPGSNWLGPAPAATGAITNPMYFRVQPTGPATPNPPVQPPSVTGHRKIVGYWAYADAIDNVNGRGHGTHVAGSVAGDAAGVVPALQPADAATLSAMKGSASSARIIVADIGCSSPPALGGCARPAIVPPRFGGCGNGALCIPSAMELTFEGARQQGARVSCNSWGGGTNSAYAAQTANLDRYVHEYAEDMLLVFAAANSGFGGTNFYSISQQAGAKNVLAVAALSDGFLAHRTKTQGMIGSGTPTPPATSTAIPPLYQALDGRACGAIVLNAAVNNAISLQPTNACPVTPTAAQCWAMAVDGRGNIPSVPGGFPTGNQYGGAQQAELAMCCGCTLALVIAGCQAPGFPCAPTTPGGPARLSIELQALTSVYNARWPAGFSSLGPVNDERIKPDVGSTGFEIMSARSSSNFQYQTGPYQCNTAPNTPSFVNNAAVGNFNPFTFTVPATELFATITIAPTTEPIRLNSFAFYATTITLPPAVTTGWFEIWIVSTTENSNNQAFPVRIPVTACSPATTPCGNTVGLPALYTFDLTMGVSTTLPGGWGGWEMGSNWAGSIQIFGTPGMGVTDLTSTTLTSSTCFSPAVGNEVEWRMSVQRGGALGYISAMSGTSMSCPAMSGIAGLVRSFYTDGFMGLNPGCNGLVQAGFCTTATTPPGVSAVPPAAPLTDPLPGFLPTASLVKATLMNAATPIIDQDYYNFFSLPLLPRWQAQAQSGHGVPNLVRGLSFASLGTDPTTITRAGGFLPTLLVPGLGVVSAGLGVTTPAAANVLCGAGCEPAVAMGGIHSYCIYPRLPAVSATGVNIPLTMTLVWTDPPGAALSAVNLVNVSVLVASNTEAATCLFFSLPLPTPPFFLTLPPPPPPSPPPHTTHTLIPLSAEPGLDCDPPCGPRGLW